MGERFASAPGATSHRAPDVAAQRLLLVARNAPNLRVTVLENQIRDHLSDYRESLVQFRLGEEPVHQRQAPAAGWSVRFRLVLAQWRTIAPGHNDPFAPAKGSLSPAWFAEFGQVIADLQLLVTVPLLRILLPRILQDVVQHCAAPGRAGGDFPGEMDRIPSGIGQEKLFIANLNNVQAVAFIWQSLPTPDGFIRRIRGSTHPTGRTRLRGAVRP